jgi:hypothetical protein
LAIPSHDATTSFASHTSFEAHGLGVGVRVAVGERVAVSVGAAVGATASESVGGAVGRVTAVDPQAARPTAAIAELKMVVRFMAVFTP